MVNQRRKLLAIIIIVSFVLFVISLMYYIDYIRMQKESGRITIDMIKNMSKEELIQYVEERRANSKDIFYYYRLIPIISFSGIAIGALVYYLLEEKVTSQSKKLKNNTKIILKMLSPGERKVIEALLEKNGKAMQFEFNRIPGFNKVKTHRILKEMELKGIIEKEKMGKVRIIKLNKDIYDVLKE